MLLNNFFEGARQHPERPAYICTQGELCYGDMARQSRALADYLRGRIPGKSPILVWGRKQRAVPVCFLASALAGLPYIPVDSGTPPPRLEEILRQAKPALILAVDPLPATSIPVVGGEEIREVCANNSPPVEQSLPGLSHGDLLYILFTSGSTGRPKGVQITYGNVNAFLRWMSRLAPLVEAQPDVVLNHARFSFDLSVADLHYALFTGKTIYVLERETQQDFPALFAALRHSGAEMAVLTPSFATYCMLDSRFDQALLPRMKVFFFCGEPLPAATVKKLFDRFAGVRIVNAYGPTETTVAVTAAEITPKLLRDCRGIRWTIRPPDFCRQARRTTQHDGKKTRHTIQIIPRQFLKGAALPVGTAGDGNTVGVISSDLQPLPPGQEGEIVVWGPQVGAGYLGEVDGGFIWENGLGGYRTGDRGVWRGDHLYCLGRTDAQIKHGGYRIELADIEANLMRLEGVAHCAAVYEGAGKPGKGRLVAFVQPEPGLVLSAERVRAALAARLPDYMLPSRIRFVERIPLNANGKCDREQLVAMLYSQ